jgi:hypothetical protein
MKPVVAILGILLAAILGAVGGWVTGMCTATKDSRILTGTMTQAEQGYLANRFVLAYRSMPANVAVWEGTNLLLYLKQKPPEAFGPEQNASQIVLYARLYQLFSELGEEQEAQACAGSAYGFFKSLTPRSGFSQSEVVSNILKTESVKRAYVAE